LPKLWTIYHAIRVRREHAASFGDQGNYTPLFASGEKREHVVSYMRGDKVIVVTPRLVLKVAQNWGDTWIDFPSGQWRNELSGSVMDGKVSIGQVFDPFPVALLVRQ
jgi:(1->4)-alpha-D-glucan 1-alpha-D-glucosylmutase